jgi:outer membrane protein OmpA-like peptidoglycan-associated protein
MFPYRFLTIDVPKINLQYCGLPLRRSGTLESFGSDAGNVDHEFWTQKRVEELCQDADVHQLAMVLTLSGYVIETIVVLQNLSTSQFPDAYIYTLNPNSMSFTAERFRTEADLNTRWVELTDTSLSALPNVRSAIAFNLTNRYCVLPGEQLTYATGFPQFFSPGLQLIDNWLFCWSTSSSFEITQVITEVRTPLRAAETALQLQLQTQFNNNQPDNEGRVKTRVGLLHNFTPFNPWSKEVPVNFGDPDVWGNVLYTLGSSHPSAEALWNYAHRIWIGMTQNALLTSVEKLYRVDRDYSLKYFVDALVAQSVNNTDLDPKNLVRYVDYLSKAIYDRLIIPGTITHQFKALHPNLGKLPWAEILFTLHNLHIIDMLSGVDLRPIPSSSIQIQPLVSYDATGFYEMIEGSDTLQINQAGNYWRGHYQMRYSGSTLRIVHYTFEAHNVAMEIDGTSTIASADITLQRAQISPLGTQYDGDTSDLPVRQTIAANLKVSFVRAATGLAPLEVSYAELSFSENEVGQYSPSAAAPFWADDVLANLDATIRDLYISSQRSPLHLYERRDLDTLVERLMDFANSPVNITSDEAFMFEFLDLMRPYGLYAGFMAPLMNVQSQLPAVRHYILFKLQTAPVPLQASQVPWVAFLFALHNRRNQTPSDPHIGWTVYQVIMTYLGIEESLLDAMVAGTEEGDYVYEWVMRGAQGGVSAGIPLVGSAYNSFSFRVKQVKPVPDANDKRWPAILNGSMAGGSIGLSPDKLVGSGVVYQTSPARLNAYSPWEPKHFEGGIWMAGGEIAFAVGIGGSVGPGQIIVYGSRSDGQSLIGETGDYVLMSGLTISAGYTATVGTMSLQATEGTAQFPISRFREVTKWQSGDDQHFSVDLPTLTDSGWQQLKSVIAEFRACLEVVESFIELSGYASPTSSSEYNLTLSQNRAQSVLNAIYQLLGPALRTPSHQIVVRGYGMEPAILIGNIEHGQENAEWRRVDIRLNGVLLTQVQGS